MNIDMAKDNSEDKTAKGKKIRVAKINESWESLKIVCGNPMSI